MKRICILLLSLIYLSLYSVNEIKGQSVVSESANGDIFAEVIPVFSAREASPLNFGKFNPGPQGGEIILSPESYAIVLGSVYQGESKHTAASFFVSGDINTTYSVSLPRNPILLTNINSSKTMEVDEWISVPSEGIGTGLLQNGFQMVYIGATLKIGSLNENPVGIYQGSYTITFDFN